MNIAVEAPELSRALVALERELRIDPVLGCPIPEM